MKYILGLLLIASCNNNEDKQYLTNGYLCDEFLEFNSGVRVENCEEVMTGKKVKVIHNPSNVFEV